MKIITLLVLLLTLSPGLSDAQMQSQPKTDKGFQLHVLQMDQTGVILELRLTDFTLENQQHEGVIYQTVVVPGLTPLTEPGQPQLPGLGELLGTPPGGIAQINILESETETINEVRLFPTPALTFSDPEEIPSETFTLDAALYHRDALFPGSPAEAGMVGQLRDQPVTQVRLYPFQYNPVQQTLTVHRRLRIQALFASPPVGARVSGPETRPDTPYEQMLQKTLLNYANLPAVASARSSVGPPGISAQSQAPALKFFVDEDGLYQVTYADLQQAGFNLSGLDPRQLQLTNSGNEVAIYVSGEADGIFDPGDWLEFYGLAAVSPFTKRNVYWLTTGDGLGLRMAERNGAPSGAGLTPTAFYATLHLEENHEYWSLLPNGEGQDHWFWERFPSAPHTSNFSFVLQNVANVSANGFIQVTLHGRTSTEQNPDHHTQISLNGTLIDEAWWDGETPFVHAVSVPQQLFRVGNNKLTVTALGDTGAGVDSLYVNHFDIGYWNSYLAENDQLYFNGPEGVITTFSIGNFSDATIHIYDISDPLRVSRLTNGLVQAEGNTYRVQVEDNVASDTRYLTLTAGQKRAPAGILLDTPSTLKSLDNGADYLIITHEDFTEAAIRLADHWASQGLRVTTVQITDVYDEFSEGLFTPQAIRDFLSYAYYYWTPPAPLYVLLVGNSNYDYQDYLATGNKNYVPTSLFESEVIGQTSTDNWFVSVSGDDFLPDMFVGRLSVRTLTGAHAVVDKILTYEQNPSPTEWQKKALFVADDQVNFQTISEGLIANLGPGYGPQRIYGETYPNPLEATPDILAAIDQGTLIANYIGHGNTTGWFWGANKIFDNNDIANLNNGPRYTFLVTGNCYNGLFSHPTTPDSLAEKFVNIKNKGGIAAWSPTGLGYAFWHDRMIEALYQAIFDDYTYQLGPATTAAKIKAFAQLGRREPIEIFTLLGDPALTIPIVQPRLTLSDNTTIAYVQPGQLLTYTLTYTNYGNEPAENVILTQIYDPQTSFHSANPSPTSGNNVWVLGSVPADASGTISVTVQVAETVPPGTVLSSQVTLESDNFDPKVLLLSNFVGYFGYLPLIVRE